MTPGQSTKPVRWRPIVALAPSDTSGRADSGPAFWVVSLAAVRRFEYDGLANVRPIGRGVYLVDRQVYLDEAVTELVDADAWGGRDARLKIIYRGLRARAEPA